jgi:Xaa-Pro aminopeptidase
MRALLLLTAQLLQAAPAAVTLPDEEFSRRRARLAEILPGGAVALDTGPLAEVGSDANTPLFDFKYLTGFHDPEGILILAGGHAVAFASDPARTPGRGEGLTVLPLDRFDAWAAEHLKDVERVYTKLRRKNLDRLSRAAPRAELVGGRLGAELARLRLTKSDAEVRLIRKASDATCSAHRAALRALKPGIHERAIQDLVESTFRKEGCPELGFPSICASGRNGTILHYSKNDRPVPPDTLMVLDIGAALENYVTDITRTLPTSGRFSPEQRRAYQTVLDAQKAAEAALRPGATFTELDEAARRVFEERGMTRWSYAHSRDGSVRHALGHYVGMAVHDSGSYREPFRPGVVLTIEPGWYDKDAGYGIRIEDIYLVTENGFERLSASAPREIDEIEKAMAEREQEDRR